VEQRLSLVTLGVADLARARRFYGEGLGWREIEPRREEIAFFQLAGTGLALWSVDELAKDAHMPPRLDGFGGITLAINLASPDAVDAALAQAERAGGHILKPAAKVFWGGYSGYFADPDDHPWEVAHNPFCTINADGTVSFEGVTKLE
jgi:catechol 2,3-dioxygenase-like lactoylglutathione lyase family enzyme